MALVERVEAAPGERRRLRLANPATLELLGELEIDGAEQVLGRRMIAQLPRERTWRCATWSRTNFAAICYFLRILATPPSAFPWR